MSYSEENIINNLRITKETKETLANSTKDKNFISLLKGNVEPVSTESYLVVTKNEGKDSNELIEKAVKVGNKFEFIDVFEESYIQKVFSKTSHKVTTITDKGLLNISLFEPKENAETTPEKKKAKKDSVETVTEPENTPVN